MKNQNVESKPQVVDIKPLTKTQPEAKQEVPEEKPQPAIVPEPEKQVREPTTQNSESKTLKAEVAEPKRKTSESDHQHQLPDPLEEPLDYEEQQSVTESEHQQDDEQMPEFSDIVETSELPAPHNDQSDLQYPPHLNQPPPHQQFPMGPRQFRPQKFGPRGMPRWMNPSGPPAPVPFPQQRPLRPNQMGPIRPGGPPQMRPGGPFPPQRPPFFMQRQGGPNRPPGPPGSRFFFQNQFI